MNCLENNLSKYLLSPRWERIEVRGDVSSTFHPHPHPPPSKGEGMCGEHFHCLKVKLHHEKLLRNGKIKLQIQRGNL
jgi:hypothetical protein